MYSSARVFLLKNASFPGLARLSRRVPANARRPPPGYSMRRRKNVFELMTMFVNTIGDPSPG